MRMCRRHDTLILWIYKSFQIITHYVLGTLLDAVVLSWQSHPSSKAENPHSPASAYTFANCANLTCARILTCTHVYTRINIQTHVKWREYMIVRLRVTNVWRAVIAASFLVFGSAGICSWLCECVWSHNAVDEISYLCSRCHNSRHTHARRNTPKHKHNGMRHM